MYVRGRERERGERRRVARGDSNFIIGIYVSIRKVDLHKNILEDNATEQIFSAYEFLRVDEQFETDVQPKQNNPFVFNFSRGMKRASLSPPSKRTCDNTKIPTVERTERREERRGRERSLLYVLILFLFYIEFQISEFQYKLFSILNSTRKSDADIVR
jgi:hypothetical protein